MPETTTGGRLRRVAARVQALRPEDWLGSAGLHFKSAMRIVSRFAKQQHLTPAELADDVVVLARLKLEGMATREHAEALKNYADEEQHRIDNRFKEKTFEAKVRQEEATAAKLESEARIAKIKEADALIDLIAKLQQNGVILTVDGQHNVTVSNAPPGFDWEMFARNVLPDKEGRRRKRLSL
jgi:phosphoglycolate phosphatase-like HAD superfamily hydrolase